MQKYSFSGKNLDEALMNAETELMCNKDEFYYNERELKTGLFRSKKVEIDVFKKSDIIEGIKEYLTKIISLMGLNAQFEIKKREDNVLITVFCENNNILIGKQGRTINSLKARTVIKSKVDAKLDPMNSYERRIIHTILSDYKNVYTESIGEEPKRCVVIKYKES